MHFKGIKCGDNPHDGCSRRQGRLTCSDDEAEERERLGKTQDLAAVLGETYWTGRRLDHFFSTCLKCSLFPNIKSISVGMIYLTSLQ